MKLFSPELLDRVNPFDYVANRYNEALSEVPVFDEDTEENARMRQAVLSQSDALDADAFGAEGNKSKPKKA